MSDDEISIRRQILSYLMEKPDAQDTLEGITEWWLLESYIRRQTNAVRRALQELESQGLVVARQGPGTPVRYRLNRDKVGEIEELLAEDR